MLDLFPALTLDQFQTLIIAGYVPSPTSLLQSLIGRFLGLLTIVGPARKSVLRGWGLRSLKPKSNLGQAAQGR